MHGCATWTSSDECGSLELILFCMEPRRYRAQFNCRKLHVGSSMTVLKGGKAALKSLVH